MPGCEAMGEYRAPKSRRNEPAFLCHVAQAIAAARGEPLETVANATTDNARRLFGLPKVQL